MKFEILVLILFGFLHTACSFSGYKIYFYSNAALPDFDFDEDDPFFESVSKPDEISSMELRRLKLRPPREIVQGAFALNSNGKGMGTEMPIAENKILNAGGGGFDDEKIKEQGSIPRELVLQNLKKADTSFDKSPFLGSKKYFLNVMATPYTRKSWEPNFLRTVVE